MTQQSDRVAWVEVPSESEVRAQIPAGTKHPYDFGFLPAMGRLLLAHQRIGPMFRKLFGEIMFVPGDLERRERELVATVASRAQDCFY